MSYKNKKITTYFIIIAFALVAGTIYALLQATLDIDGSSLIKSGTWDIHFANIQVTPGSVSIGTGDSAATIDPGNNCKVDFSVSLAIPGDFYEFTVDVVNAGTIDGMLNTFVKTLKVNNEVVSTLPEYITYSVTYVDGIELQQYQLLGAGETETYKIRIELDSSLEVMPPASTITANIALDFIQADSGAIKVPHPQTLLDTIAENAVIDNIASTYVTNANGIQFNAISSDTNGKGIYLRAGTENDTYPIYYYRGDVDNNHVKFANFCWKIVRTTDTGGVKLIYDGVPSNEGACNNTRKATNISTTNIKFNENYNSPAYVGYMYGDVYTDSSATGTNWYYGPDVTYENGTYTLTSKGSYNVEKKSTISGTNLNYHHYTCGSEEATTCTSVRYVYKADANVYYITLTDGKKVEDALSEMFSNTTNSTIKTAIDTWYQSNMTSYTNKLEDTVYCNDRSIFQLGGWNPDGGSATSPLHFSGYNRANTTYAPNLGCTNKNDAFTVKETGTGNGKLTYPVGLLTSDEAMLAGMKYVGKVVSAKVNYLNANASYWLGSPLGFSATPDEFYVRAGNLYLYAVDFADGCRVAVSLKPGTQISVGSGTSSDPYIVE